MATSTYNTLLDNRVGIIPAPAGFGWADIPFSIYRKKDSSVHTTFHPKIYDVPRAVTRYVDADNGSNANDGLTEETAWQTIAYAISTLNSLAPASAEIILCSLRHLDLGWGNNALAFPATIRSKNGHSIVATYDGTGFTLHAGSTYYRAGSALSGAIDTLHRDSYGGYYKLSDAGSLASCEATAGTYYDDGVGLYVHLIDGRAPDQDMYVIWQGAQLTTAHDLYLEGIETIGQQNSIRCFANDVTLVFNNCTFVGSRINAFDLDGTNCFYLSKNCTIYNHGADGFSYKGAGSKALEDSCLVASGGGYFDSDNNSTSHEGIPVIRVGGTYLGGAEVARTVHDIDIGTTSWNVGCYAKTGDRDGDSFGNPAWCIGSGVSDTAKMWLDDCYASGDGYWFNVAGGSSEMYFKDFIPLRGTKNNIELMSAY